MEDDIQTLMDYQNFVYTLQELVPPDEITGIQYINSILSIQMKIEEIERQKGAMLQKCVLLSLSSGFSSLVNTYKGIIQDEYQKITQYKHEIGLYEADLEQELKKIGTPDKEAMEAAMNVKEAAFLYYNRHNQKYAAQE